MKSPIQIAIVTDSTADIPQDLVEEHHIHVVPNIIVIDGEGLEDGAGISRQDFYRRLPEMKTSPSTATASSGAYQALYEGLLKEGYKNILSIHTSSLLSGILNAASAGAQSFGERVQVIDSGFVTMGLGFQVLAAAEAAGRGLSRQAIQNCLADVRQRVRVIAMLDTLEYLRRSGRVSWAKARLGNLLHLKAFVEVKYGRVLSLGEGTDAAQGHRTVEGIPEKSGTAGTAGDLTHQRRSRCRADFKRCGARSGFPAFGGQHNDHHRHPRRPQRSGICLRASISILNKGQRRRVLTHQPRCKIVNGPLKVTIRVG